MLSIPVNWISVLSRPFHVTEFMTVRALQVATIILWTLQPSKQGCHGCTPTFHTLTSVSLIARVAILTLTLLADEASPGRFDLGITNESPISMALSTETMVLLSDEYSSGMGMFFSMFI